MLAHFVSSVNIIIQIMLSLLILPKVIHLSSFLYTSYQSLIYWLRVFGRDDRAYRRTTPIQKRFEKRAQKKYKKHKTSMNTTDWFWNENISPIFEVEFNYIAIQKGYCSDKQVEREKHIGALRNDLKFERKLSLSMIFTALILGEHMH